MFTEALHSPQRVETTQVSVDGLDKYNVVHPHNGARFHLNKDENSDTRHSMDGP